MDIFSIDFNMKSCDAAQDGKIKLSSLFSYMQKAASAHLDILSCGAKTLKDENLLWVVIRYNVSFSFLPICKGKITAETWAGKNYHFLYPRFFRLLDENKNCFCSAFSIWTLVDSKTRTFATGRLQALYPPSAEISTKELFSMMNPIISSIPPDANISYFSVPPENIDFNEHMNNACYIDLAEEIIARPSGSPEIKQISIEYENELRLDETVKIYHWAKNNKEFLCGVRDKRMFSLCAEYSIDI